jgi:hypothetical protein
MKILVEKSQDYGGLSYDTEKSILKLHDAEQASIHRQCGVYR